MLPHRSFLLRVWRVNEAQRSTLRFGLEDVTTHASTTFISLAELHKFLEREMAELGLPPVGSEVRLEQQVADTHSQPQRNG